MTRPRKHPTQKSRTITVSMTPDMIELCKYIGGGSMSRGIHRAITTYNHDSHQQAIVQERSRALQERIETGAVRS